MLGVGSPDQASTGDERSSIERASAVLLVAAALCVLGIAAYAYIGSFARYWADDFCFASHSQRESLWGAQKYWYLNWHGAVPETFVLDLLTRIGPAIVPFLPAVMLSLWLAVMTWASFQLSKLVFGRGQLPLSLFCAALIVFAYVSLVPNRVQSVYWLTGGVGYTGPILVFTAYLGFVVWCYLSPGRDKWLVLGAGFLLGYLGGSGTALLVWQGVFLGLAFVAFLLLPREIQSRLRLPLLAGIAGTVFAAIVFGAAPGNAVRAAAYPPRLPLSEVVPASLRSAREFLTGEIVRPEVLLLGLAAALLAFIVQKQDGGKTRLDPSNLALCLLGAFVACACLIGATYAPAYYVTNFAPVERSLATGTLTVIATVMFAGYLAGFALRPYLLGAIEPNIRRVSGAALVLLLLVTGAIVLPRTWNDLAGRDPLVAYAAAWDRRDAEIKLAKRRGADDVTLAAIDSVAGLSEATREPAAWINRCIADYYGLGSLRTR